MQDPWGFPLPVRVFKPAPRTQADLKRLKRTVLAMPIHDPERSATLLEFLIGAEALSQGIIHTMENAMKHDAEEALDGPPPIPVEFTDTLRLELLTITEAARFATEVPQRVRRIQTLSPVCGERALELEALRTDARHHQHRMGEWAESQSKQRAALIAIQGGGDPKALVDLERLLGIREGTLKLARTEAAPTADEEKTTRPWWWRAVAWAWRKILEGRGERGSTVLPGFENRGNRTSPGAAPSSLAPGGGPGGEGRSRRPWRRKRWDLWP